MSGCTCVHASCADLCSELCTLVCTVLKSDPLSDPSTPRPFLPTHSVLPLLKSICKGVTPFLFACSTGVADIVKYLARIPHFNSWHRDGNERGAVQLAMNSGGEHQRLATWLRDNCRDEDNVGLPETNGTGRPSAERTRGGFQSDYRNACTFNPSKGKGRGKRS